MYLVEELLILQLSYNRKMSSTYIVSNVALLWMQQTMSYILATILVALATISGVTMQSSMQSALAQGLPLSSPACGQVVHGNVTLTANLVCTGDGLIVGGDNTTINLNGYSITGPGENSSKVGINIPHSNSVVISGSGAIRNFQAGVFISGSENTNVHRVTFDGNKIAIFVSGSIGSTVEQNFIGPNAIGVASHSSIEFQVHANMMTGNDLAGVTLVNTDKSQVDANSIGGSKNGIFLDAQSTRNTILYNNVLKNTVDINNADGLPLNINGNELIKNNCFVSQPSGGCNPQ